MEVSIRGARVLRTFTDVPVFGTVQITQTLAVSTLVMLILSGLLIWLGSGLKVTGISRRQAAAELIYCSLVRFVRGNMGSEFDRYIPLVGAIFSTSVLSNLISLLGFWSPTADLMTVLAWALVVFVIITFHKLRAAGLRGYFRGFLEPIPLLLPINILSECFTPLSMAFRHFGNILSGAVIGSLIYGALTSASLGLYRALSEAPWVDFLLIAAGGALMASAHRKRWLLPVGFAAVFVGISAALPTLGAAFPWLTLGIPILPGLYFDWFGGFIQAFIFCTLTTLFIRRAAGRG